jgi:hypothetical protein
MTGFLRKYWVGAAVVGVFMVVFAALFPLMSGRDAIRDHSALRKNAFGCAALAELCESVEPPLHVRRITRSLDDLTEVRGPLLIIDPEYPFSDAEIDELIRWIERGGTLIAAFEGTWDDPPSFRPAAGPAYLQLASALGVSLVDQGRQVRTAVPAPSSPLANSVERVAVETRYVIAPLAGQDAADSWASAEAARGKVECVLPHDEGDMTRHLVSDGRSIMVSFQHGRGKVYASSDAQLFANAMLPSEDNLPFVANLLWGSAVGADVYFDEYHHGFGARATEGSEVDPTPLYRAAGAAVVGCVLFLIGKSIRFGAPRSLHDRRRRSAAEYVEAMAGLWHGARAYHWALEQIADTFRRRIATAVGVAPSAPSEALVDAFAERRGVSRKDLTKLFADLQEALSAPALTERRSAALVRRIAQFEEAISRPPTPDAR